MAKDTRSGVPAGEKFATRIQPRTHWLPLSVNLTSTERLARVAVGLIVAITGVTLLSSATSTVAIVVESLLVATGLDLVVTGVLGHCPLYTRLGRALTPLQRRS